MAPDGNLNFHTGDIVYPNKLPVAAYITYIHTWQVGMYLFFLARLVIKINIYWDKPSFYYFFFIEY